MATNFVVTAGKSMKQPMSSWQKDEEALQLKLHGAHGKKRAFYGPMDGMGHGMEHPPPAKRQRTRKSGKKGGKRGKVKHKRRVKKGSGRRGKAGNTNSDNCSTDMEDSDLGGSRTMTTSTNSSRRQ